MAPASVQESIVSLLIVDDNLVQRAQVGALCRQLGVQMVYEAGSGEEALDLLSLLVLPPDVMIVDLEMPRMDGVELIEQMHDRGVAVPLVVASSREAALIETVETMARNLGLPVLAALRKPLHVEALRQAFDVWTQVHGQVDGVPHPIARQAVPDIPVADLRAAIAGDRIEVHYQPKVDMLHGELCGVEALARWRHPVLGNVRPDVFVALAEREGMIAPLTLSVMRAAIAQAADWHAQGLELSMAINLSPRLFEDTSLVQHAAAMLAQYAVPPKRVVLEVTESSVVDCLGAALGVLARLRLRGFGLSIDDYGTGFSSLQQLARVPFSELKIDRSFVHGAHRRPNLRVILRSALDMARQLGLVTVAEGIELPEDWQLVRDSGCTVGQGFLVSRAMPGPDLPAWLAANRDRVHELGLPH
ncbi:MAG TPA: EAL domain-containing response regulator [Burkholderiaceae bacterium]